MPLPALSRQTQFHSLAPPMVAFPSCQLGKSQWRRPHTPRSCQSAVQGGGVEAISPRLPNSDSASIARRPAPGSREG